MAIESISFFGATYTPSFSPGIYTYYINYVANAVQVEIDGTRDALTTSITIRYGDVVRSYDIHDQTTFHITDNFQKQASNINFLVIYGNTTIYGFQTETPDPGITHPYPLQRNLLDPGYFGGTYIPNYRRCWYIYPTGNDPDWYPDTHYTEKVDLNLKVLNGDEEEPGINYIIQRAETNGEADAIVELFSHYSGFVNGDLEPSRPYSSDLIDYRWYLPIIRVGVNRPSTLQGGYTPKNNKLFCYPYASLELQGYGQNQELKYEDFDDKTSVLKYMGLVSKFLPGATIMLYPFDYNGIEDNFDYGVCGNELPVYPYTVDKFMNEYNAARNTRTQNMAAMLQSQGYMAATAWMGALGSVGSVNKTVTPGTQGTEVPVYNGGNASSMIGSGNMGFTNSNMNAPIYQDHFSGGSGVYEGGTPGKTAYTGGWGFAGAAAQAARQVGASLLTIHQGYAALAAELADTQNRPPVVSNQNAAPSIPIAIKEGACPYVVYKSIRKEIAQRIDTFFTRFGYRTNRMGTPNIYKRPYFSFLKCHNAIIGGNIPADDKEALKVIFQKGVTFWHTSQQGFTEVGDYDTLSDLNVAAIR